MRMTGMSKAAGWALVAMLAGAGVGHAQVFVGDPGAEPSPEASAATTVMLDPVYLNSLIPAEAYVAVPLGGPARGIRTNLPGTFLSYSVARVNSAGELEARCFAPGELTVPLSAYLETGVEGVQ